MGDVDIKKRLGAQLKQQGATPADLDQKGVHMLAAEDGKLHVLLKETEGAAPVDALVGELETRDKTYAVKITGGKDTLDLGGELGSWAIYAVEGINDKIPAGPADAPTMLHIFSAETKGQEAGAQFFASVDMAFAIGSVLKTDDIVIRGLPLAEGSVKITPELARLISDRLHLAPLDDRATAQVIKRAVDDFLGYRERVSDTGLISLANLLGVIETGPKLPIVNVYTGSEAPKSEARRAGELSSAAKDELEKLDLLPSGRLTAQWAEDTIRALAQRSQSQGGLDDLVRELRVLRVELKSQANTAKASLWGDDEPESASTSAATTSAKADLPVLNQGKQEKALKLRLAQLRAGLEGYGVSDETIQQIARQVVAATINPRETGLIVISGERFSAADQIEALVLQAIGGPQVRATRDDIVDKGAPGMYGLTPRGDALLNGPELKNARDRALGHKVSIVFDNFEAAGTSEPEPAQQAQARGVLLKNILEMRDAGSVNVFSLAESGMKSVPLSSTVLLVRDERAPAEFESELAADPKLAALKPFVIKADRPDANAAIHRLLADLTDTARAEGFSNAKVQLAPDLRREIETAIEELSASDGATYAAQMTRLTRDVAAAVIDAATSQEGGKTFTVGFSDLLLDEEEQRQAVRGDVVFGSYDGFSAKLE